MLYYGQMFLFLFSILLIRLHNVQSQRDQLFEGDSCGVTNGVQYTCKKIQECQSAFEMIRGDERPKICGYNGFVAIVCCKPEVSKPTAQPPVEVTPPKVPVLDNKPKPTNGRKRISERKCEEYKEYVFQPDVHETLSIGWGDDDEVEEPKRTKRQQKRKQNTCGIAVEPLIVGGEKAKPREFPHQVNIGYLYGRRKVWLCTGSLISENFVLSAAHCSRTNYGPPKLAVVGDLDISSNSDDANPQELRIVEIINFPVYKHGFPYFDIALYRLEKNVTIDGYKRPACLNTNRNIQVKEALASGWGNIRADGPSSDYLMKVSIDLIPVDVCRQYWFQGGTLTRGIDDEQMICAGDLNGPKDTCQGDSGGPLQYVLRDSCMYSLIGVTGFGRSCGIKVPGVYARISYYVPWIESIVWPNEK